jgi:hypothetical protein
MIWATKLISTNPWVVVGILLTLAGAFGATFVYGVRVGGNAEALACERRVSAIHTQLAEKNAEIERLNSAWEKAIGIVQDTYNKTVADEELKAAELAKRINEYEATLEAIPSCGITADDIRRVRGQN